MSFVAWLLLFCKRGASEGMGKCPDCGSSGKISTFFAGFFDEDTQETATVKGCVLRESVDLMFTDTKCSGPRGTAFATQAHHGF